uniref:Beta-fructofuranosidase, insoluble isoenzyme CWINV5 n=1 Tax=Litchi chinensis TaxID=151069 RepID=A0A248XBI2_LITCN|nr:beta-fructofuranosidase, insoluble isoenzyme CWINV5 [Litchi chinensis]
MANTSISLSFLFVSALFLGHQVLELEASHHIFETYQTTPKVLHKALVNQAYRTGYHFQPPKHWINDPNGPMVYKGIYHLFYQYNPKGAVWGNIVWAHSTSRDLVNWTAQKQAIFPSQQQADINECWSGSATILPGGKPVILYTGVDSQEQQVQNLAMPKNLSDPHLTEWIKYPKNPLMKATPTNKINGSAFRDPTTAWQGPDNVWRVLIGSRVNKRGLAILYKSKDFKHWKLGEKPLHSAEGTGMWECPDFFPVKTNGNEGLDTSARGENVKYVLKNSLDDTKHDYYTVGTYDSVKDKYIPGKGMIEGDSGLRYDYGKFYASKTFFDSEKQRRVLWGWINESSSVEDDVQKGWSGVQAIPRHIWLDKSGKQLLQWPIKEIEKLRGNQVKWPSRILEGASQLEVVGVTAGQADIEVGFEINDLKNLEVLKEKQYDPQLLCSKNSASEKGEVGPFGFLTFASNDLREYTAVFYRIYKHQNKHKVLLCSDQSRSSLNKHNDKTTYGAFVDVDPANEQLSLRSLIDRSIVESFGGKGKAVITSRVYPTLAVDDQIKLFVFNNGTSKVKISYLNAWSMNKAQIN